MRLLLIVLLLLYGLLLPAQPVRNDVVIDEIMADPSPSAGLPDAEFIELKNVSQKPVNLSGWKISDATTTATISTGFILLPDSFVIICSNGAAPAFSAYGKTVGISSFPSLDNDGEMVVLTSKEGKIIHAVEYRKSWYKNAVKSEGGWTLEMIDTRNPCSGATNWTAAVAAKGGTPGQKNSATAINADHDPPVLLKAYATDSMNIMLLFSEPLDSSSATGTSDYNISDGIGPPVSASAVVPLFSKVSLRLSRALQQNKVYTVTAHSVDDCSGNAATGSNSMKAGWASAAQPGDVVINEILFNPKPDGTDYVELYNKSNRIIDLKDLYIGNRTAGNAIGSLRQLSAESNLLFPQAYVVITENAGMIQQQYLAKNPDVFIEISAMPSYPDDKGVVVLLNATGAIIDELHYDGKWHFALLDNTEGISLERISYSKPTQDAQNWHSAATSAGYGTPGYENSQFRPDASRQEAISINPAIFSPDNDGYDDVTTIQYRFPEPGYVCNITIFDAGGKPVRRLARNALCGLKGYFRWDGLDDQNNRLHTGIYILMAETFNLHGDTQKFKQAIVIATRLH